MILTLSLFVPLSVLVFLSAGVVGVVAELVGVLSPPFKSTRSSHEICLSKGVNSFETHSVATMANEVGFLGVELTMPSETPFSVFLTENISQL